MMIVMALMVLGIGFLVYRYWSKATPSDPSTDEGQNNNIIHHNNNV